MNNLVTKPEYNFSLSELQIANDYLSSYYNVIDGSGGLIKAPSLEAADNLATKSALFKAGRRAYYEAAGFQENEFDGRIHSIIDANKGYEASVARQATIALKLKDTGFVTKIMRMYAEAYTMNEQFDQMTPQ